MREGRATTVIALCVLMLAGYGLYIAAQRMAERAILNAPLGSSGLAVWLPQRQIEVVNATRRESRQADSLSLRILPLLDIRLAYSGLDPEDLDSIQRDLDRSIYYRKINRLPSVVVLPKWRDGVNKKEVAAPLYLIAKHSLASLLADMDLDGLRLTRGGPVFAQERVRAAPGGPERDLALFGAQLFETGTLPESCRTLIGFGGGALAIRCDMSDGPYPLIVVSDPDLMNNHGLGVAGNADFVADWIAALRGADETRPVYLDQVATETLRTEVLDEPREATYERDADDLARFFDYPFPVFWGLGLLVLTLAFWRGARRFGAPLRGDADRIEASRTAAILAKARLLRLSGNDGRMAGEFAQAQMLELAATVLGPGQGRAALPRLYTLIGRRDAALARDLQDTVETLNERGPDMAATEIHDTLYRYRDLIKRAKDELG